jgi:hypothetical protein
LARYANPAPDSAVDPATYSPGALIAPGDEFAFAHVQRNVARVGPLSQFELARRCEASELAMAVEVAAQDIGIWCISERDHSGISPPAQFTCHEKLAGVPARALVDSARDRGFDDTIV